MDKIKIRGLEVWAKHGVFEEEKALGQKFVISADLFLDTRKAGMTDDLNLSVHYGEVCQFMKAYTQQHPVDLIETAAEQLVHEVLVNYPLIQSMRLELMKPWAPVGLPLETVGVEITRGRHTAYIALGSNIGDSQAYLQFAVEELKKTKDCHVEQVSSFLRTAPYGGVDQPDFLNGCLKLTTLLTPEELLDELHRIESAAGRERIVRWGPRTLDLDIIFYDQIILDTPELHIPHIDMENRDFVLKPLAELCPEYRHPVLMRTVEQLLAAL